MLLWVALVVVVQVLPVVRSLDTISFEEAAVFYDAALSAGRAGDHDAHMTRSLQCLVQTLSTYPDHAAAHNMLGLVLQRQGQARAAIACFTAALHFQPEFPEVRLRVCVLSPVCVCV